MNNGKKVSYYPLNPETNDYSLYGLWNCLIAYTNKNEFIELIPAHDGDFFPESPIDHVELLRDFVIAKKGVEIPFRPIRVDIDITQKCCDSCYFCYSKMYRNNSLYKNAEINITDFERLIEALAKRGTRCIRFTGGGEPLLHPEIENILPIPKKYGLKSCIITNGDRLNNQICELLVSNIDHIRISVNSGENETRQILHQSPKDVNSLKEILKYIKYLIKLREKESSQYKKPLIWATFLLLPDNFKEIVLATELLRKTGIDSISFRPVYHNLGKPFSPEEYDSLKCQLNKALGYHNPPNFSVFIPKREIADSNNLHPRNLFANCISCYTRTIIEATNNGPSIKVCGLHRGIDGENIGIIHKTMPFTDIWDQWCDKMDVSKRPYGCKKCIDVSMNVTLNKIYKVLIDNPTAVFYKGWYDIK